MQYAHIFGSKAKGFYLHICGVSIVGIRPVGHYATKAEAKAVAKSRGAIPYNY